MLGIFQAYFHLAILAVSKLTILQLHLLARCADHPQTKQQLSNSFHRAAVIFIQYTNVVLNNITIAKYALSHFFYLWLPIA